MSAAARTSTAWRRRPIRALNLCHAVTPTEFCYRSVAASMSAVALHGRCIRACPALLTDMNCMAHIRLSLYFSGLTFRWRPSRYNRLARVSKSRNGGPCSVFNCDGKAVRIDAIVSGYGMERFRSSRNLRLSVTPLRYRDRRVVHRPAGDRLKSACNVSHIAVDELYTSNILGHYMTF